MRSWLVRSMAGRCSNRTFRSFPLDGAGRFVRQVEKHGADAGDFEKLGLNFAEQIVRHTHYLGGHSIDGINRAQHDRIRRAERDQHYGQLPDLLIESRFVREASYDSIAAP